MGILDIRRGKKAEGTMAVATADNLQEELGTLTAEIRACERTIREGASVDAIEQAMVRKGALEIRQGIVRTMVSAEKAQAKEDERAAMQAEGEALKAAALAAGDGLLEPMLALFNSIGQIHKGLTTANLLLAKSWNQPRPYWNMNVQHFPLTALRIQLGRDLADKWPERFTWTAQGVVDKKGEIV